VIAVFFDDCFRTQELQKSLPSRFTKCQRGGVAMTFGLIAPILLGSAGLAFDYVTYSLKRTQLQAAADSAAIAGAQELSVASSNDKSIKFVTDQYAKKSVSSISNVTSETFVDRKKSSLTIRVTEIWTPAFAEFIGAQMTPIVTTATASIVGSSSICVLTLSPTRNKAVHLDKDALLTAKGCGVYANSTHRQGVRLDKNSKIKAEIICSAGGYISKTGAAVPEPIADCPTIPDPLAARGEPVVGGCVETGFVIKSGKKTLNPGNYCKGLKISGDANVTFAPGVYIVSDGTFEVSGEAKISGTHVGFFLNGEKAILDFKDNASVNLTGAVEGVMTGLLFYESRASSIGRKHNLSCAHTDVLTGTIYLPNGNLRIEPNATVAAKSDYTAIIANTIELDEGPELIMNSDYSASDVPLPAGMILSGNVVLTN
jgi:Flp pilus assembly protein TadG